MDTRRSFLSRDNNLESHRFLSIATSQFFFSLFLSLSHDKCNAIGFFCSTRNTSRDYIFFYFLYWIHYKYWCYYSGTSVVFVNFIDVTMEKNEANYVVDIHKWLVIRDQLFVQLWWRHSMLIFVKNLTSHFQTNAKKWNRHMYTYTDNYWTNEWNRWRGITNFNGKYWISIKLRLPCYTRAIFER